MNMQGKDDTPGSKAPAPESEQTDGADAAASGDAVALETGDAGAAPAPLEAEQAAALAAARAQAGEYKDQLLRALAETENVRRRTQRDRDEALKYAIAGFAKDLLVVADNLRRALDAIPKEALAGDEALRTLATGVEMTERLLQGAFERHNLKRIEPIGEKFDSHLHQAVFEVPGSGQPAGTVVQLLETGYQLHDRLLRPAMVGVAKAEPAAKGGNGAAPAAGNSGSDEPSGSAG
ncbi:MAG: nucleotide exchange factor GrpE [Dongiaceae bacterium]